MLLKLVAVSLASHPDVLCLIELGLVMIFWTYIDDSITYNVILCCKDNLELMLDCCSETILSCAYVHYTAPILSSIYFWHTLWHLTFYWVLIFS